jgi:phosphate transport system substrate-binding protein
VTEITSTSGSIGYAAEGQVGSGPKIISIDSVTPTAANVETNAYKFWNVEHLFTKGAATPLEAAFIKYFNSTYGLQQADTLDFIPLDKISSAALTAHNAVAKPA